MPAAAKKKQTTVVFTSRASRLKVILSPEVPPQFNLAGGQIAGKVAEKAAQFENGTFVADQKAAEKLGIPLEELIGRLREHSGYVTGDFFEVPNEVAAPDASDDLQTIALLSVERNVGELERMLEEELATWGREKVVETLEAAIASLVVNAAPEGS